MLLFRYFLFVFVVLKYVYADTGCFETESSSTAISGCACHSTCQKCGYNSDPIEADDCVTCADPAHVITAVYADGTGTCARPTGCFETESSSAAISGCACHSTCQKCGYNSDPTGADDCVTCADGSHVITAVYTDGTGTCAADPEKKTGCFETESSSDAISGCACHSTCQKCGYNSDPIEADDCVTCADGSHVITAVYADGTGTCAPPPPPPPPPLPSSTSTLTGLLGLISASVVAFVLV